MLLIREVHKIIRLLSLVVMIWIYSVGGGMMQEMMMKSWEGEQKVKAIPIPIPVFIKENTPPPPSMPMMMMKSKDWIWKLMMLKVMKDHNKPPKCSKKIIVFPSKNKCDKGSHNKKSKCPSDATTPPPPEDEPDYYDGPQRMMMGWETFG